MGPWCGYRSDVWYAGDFGVAPDMFWVMPRRHARLALASSLSIALECDTGQACCNNSKLLGRSVWILQYWGPAIYGLRIHYNSLLGSGTVARNPTKPQREGHRGSNRDCTLHLGCW